MTRWALVTLGAFILLGVLGVATARFFGKSGSRLSIQVAVVAQWLGAYVLWSFAAGLAAKYRLISDYEAGWFVLFAVVAGLVALPRPGGGGRGARARDLRRRPARVARGDPRAQRRAGALSASGGAAGPYSLTHAR